MASRSVPTPGDPLAQPLEVLRGVGVERIGQLARLGLSTVGDLLFYRPRRYEDRRQCRAVAQLVMGEAALARGRVVAQGIKWYRHRTKSVFECILDDGTGRLHCRWWNQPFMQHQFKVGEEQFVYGKLLSTKPRTIDHPETELVVTDEETSLHLNRIVPIYSLTEGLSQRGLRALVWQAINSWAGQIREPWPDLGLRDLPARAQAVRDLHFPSELSDADRARQRLALDEFIDLQLQIQRRRRNLQIRAEALPSSGDNRLLKPFLGGLGYPLTAAQTKVLRELRQDMAGPQPMRRLLQGDVGSGKTVVAACCALMAIESGYSVVLMAPTEVLAEQHFQTFRRWFLPLGIPVHLQTGSYKTLLGGGQGAKCEGQRTMSGEQRSEARDQKSEVGGQRAEGRGQRAEDRGQRGKEQSSMASAQHLTSNVQPPALNPGSPSAPLLVIGTHALIEKSFTVPKLGLVIIDEQHKFGVAQREQLVRKGYYPHLLVMTATPIPRTLGLTLYGDLDCSVIDQAPPGRGRIRTFVRTADKLPKVWEFICGQLTEGRQAYVVYPLVDESEKSGLKAVTAERQKLSASLAPFHVGLLHGRLKAEEKEEVLTAFRANEIQVLLATTVVEVGLDVPNATIMLVENADQFGLSQLHQLRGRIGRGAHDSFCILIARATTEEARQRLQVLAETTDGFRIAETDLLLRGPGDFLGREQSGLPPLRFGQLTSDVALIERARHLAVRLLDAPELAQPRMNTDQHRSVE